MNEDEAMRKGLAALGIAEELHAPMMAVQDQIKAWEREHPGQDALTSGECDHLFIALGRLARVWS